MTPPCLSVTTVEREHVTEEKRTEEERERVQRRNTHADITPVWKPERDDQGDCGENANPPVPKKIPKLVLRSGAEGRMTASATSATL